VELSDDAKYAMKGKGIFTFFLELGGLLET
jgi:hypothetical protein